MHWLNSVDCVRVSWSVGQSFEQEKELEIEEPEIAGRRYSQGAGVLHEVRFDKLWRIFVKNGHVKTANLYLDALCVRSL